MCIGVSAWINSLTGICVCVWEGGGGRCTHDESLSDMDDVIMTACYRTKKTMVRVCVCGGGRDIPAGSRRGVPTETTRVCVVCVGGGGEYTQ